MTIRNQAIQTALDGDWQKAIELNKNLVKENPDDIDALNRLALAYSIIGKVKEAKSTYQKVVKLDPLNSIALKNLKRIKDSPAQSLSKNGSYTINNKFLEEPGKTKIIELVNIAQARKIELLRTGQSLNLSIKRLKIFLQDGDDYIGVLPDDLARRLIKFMKAGCSYEAYVKSASSNRVAVFIKEIKKTGKYKNQPSFITTQDTALVISKSARNAAKNEEEETETNYLDE